MTPNIIRKLRYNGTDPAIVSALNALAEEVYLARQEANKEIINGPGIRIASQDGRSVVIENSATTRSSGTQCNTWGVLKDPTASDVAYKIQIRCGTIGGVLPTNHASTFSIAIDTSYFIVASCTLSNGEVSSVTLSVDATPTVNAWPIQANTPPTSVDIVLATARNYRACFNYTGNISINPVEKFRTITGSGAVPFTFYYGFEIV